MSAVIDAIGYRVDLPARARYRFSHIVHDVGEALSGKPDGHNGGDGGLLAAGEEKVSSMIQSAQTGLSGMAGAVEERISDAGQAVWTGLSDIKETVMDTMTTATGTATTEAQRTGEQMQQQLGQVKDTAVGTWRRVGGFAKGNALAFGFGAVAAGIVAGMFLPKTKMEQESIGPMAGELRHKAVDAGEKALRKGHEMAEHTMDSMQHGEAQPGQQGTPPQPSQQGMPHSSQQGMPHSSQQGMPHSSQQGMPHSSQQGGTPVPSQQGTPQPSGSHTGEPVTTGSDHR